MTRRRLLRPALYAGGFALLWALGLWPHWVSLWLAVPGALLFFAVAHLISRKLALGGLPGLGLAFSPGWPFKLLAGFLAGIAAVLVYVMLAVFGERYEEIAFRPLDEIGGTILLAALNTAYVGFWEETLCRGYLLKVLRQRFTVPVLAILSGLAFVPFHFTQFGKLPDFFLAYWFISGVAFAIPLLLTGSLWLSIGLHWGHNLAFTLLLTRSGWLVAERGSPAGWYSESMLLVVPVLLLVPGIALSRRSASARTTSFRDSAV